MSWAGEKHCTLHFITAPLLVWMVEQEPLHKTMHLSISFHPSHPLCGNKIPHEMTPTHLVPPPGSPAGQQPFQLHIVKGHIPTFLPLIPGLQNPFPICGLVTQSCPTLCNQTSLSFTISWSLLRFMSIQLVMLSNHPYGWVILHCLSVPYLFYPSLSMDFLLQHG